MVDSLKTCQVCGESVKELYAGPKNQSITSLSRIVHYQARVFACASCGHSQTTIPADLDKYYDSEYKISLESVEEDEIYAVVDGKKIFRSDHQAKTFFTKISPPFNARILDFGGAKGATLRKLSGGRKDLECYIYDVSKDYVPFWEKFLPPKHWATHKIPKVWKEQFDVVTSFFSLEHIQDPLRVLLIIHGLLKFSGTFYGIVPNVFTNFADLIVADHVNHFSTVSLKTVFERSGFELLEIDEQAHRGTYVITARKRKKLSSEFLPDPKEVKLAMEKLKNISEFWKAAASQVQSFEESFPSNTKTAIYGAGFYGTFFSTVLKNPQQQACFIDQNTFLQGKTHLGKKVLSPGALPQEVTAVIVALNPTIAKSVINSIPEWKNRDLNFFYLQNS